MGNLHKTKSKSKNSQALQPAQKQLLSMRLEGRDVNQFKQLDFNRMTQSLGSLSLHECKLGSTGCKILAKVKWPDLKNLIITENQTGDHGIFILVKADMPNLTNLNLMGNFLRDASCKALTKGNWKKLQNITINQRQGNEKRVNRITKLGISFLRLMNLKNFDSIKPTEEVYEGMELQDIQLYKYM